VSGLGVNPDLGLRVVGTRSPQTAASDLEQSLPVLRTSDNRDLNDSDFPVCQCPDAGTLVRNNCFRKSGRNPHTEACRTLARKKGGGNGVWSG
jgi:hypothetical protein